MVCFRTDLLTCLSKTVDADPIVDDGTLQNNPPKGLITRRSMHSFDADPRRERDVLGSKIKVENIHYDLTEGELEVQPDFLQHCSTAANERSNCVIGIVWQYRTPSQVLLAI